MSKKIKNILLVCLAVTAIFLLIPKESNAEAVSRTIYPYYSFYQNDYSDYIVQDCGESIAENGSALTALAIVYDYYKQEDKTPVEINAILGSEECGYDWNNAAEILDLKEPLISNDYNDYSKSLISDAIISDKLAIMGLIKKGSIHYVVVNGYYYNERRYSELYIIDTEKSKNYENLSDYLNEGWLVKEYIIY